MGNEVAVTRELTHLQQHTYHCHSTSSLTTVATRCW